MTEFEVLLVPISLILGLGVTRVLGGFVVAARSRKRCKPHWLPLLWASSILLLQILYFNVLYDLGRSERSWTWLLYGSVLFQSMLLFVGGGLVLPGESEVSAEGMLADFEEDGRLALVPIAILLATAPVLNRLQYGTSWLSSVTLLNVALTGVALVALTTHRRAVHSAMAMVFAALTVFGVFFVWAQPGGS